MISSRLSEVCLVVQSIYLLSIVLLLSCVLLATMGGWQQIIPGLSRSTNYITMSMGYYRDKILANYICQLHWQKTPRLYPGAGDSGPFWWEIWAENDPSQPPVFRCSENLNIAEPMFADWTVGTVETVDSEWTSCFGPPGRPWCFSGPDSWECFVKTNESWDNGWKTQEYRLRSLWWNVLDYADLYSQRKIFYIFS